MAEIHLQGMLKLDYLTRNNEEKEKKEREKGDRMGEEIMCIRALYSLHTNVFILLISYMYTMVYQRYMARPKYP